LPLVLFPQQLTPPYFPELSSACRRAGFVPNVGQRVTQPYTMLTLVAQEMGVGFVPASAQQLAVAGVAFVPVRDLPESFDAQLLIAWTERKTPRLVAELVALICRLDASADDGGNRR
jgi:DNA-binding transcriptional LysR family regulator